MFKSVAHLYLLSILPFVAFSTAQAQVNSVCSESVCLESIGSESNLTIEWEQLEPGYEVARYDVTAPNALIRSQVVLARFDPKHFAFAVSFAPDIGTQRADIQSMVRKSQGVAAINANYFDVDGNALGLVIADGKEKNRLHRGGRALTGLFVEDASGRFRIIQRMELGQGKPKLALQSGPRLIVNRTAVDVDAAESSNRRSGAAVTADNRIIIFATMTRFPGATFRDLQEMLLQPELNVTDAINFDGGSSSQIFLHKADDDGADLVISGGDLVPVALVVRRRQPLQ